MPAKVLTCEFCPATTLDTSKYRSRFKRRHLTKGQQVCVLADNARVDKAIFNQQLAEGVRSVEDATTENQ